MFASVPVEYRTLFLGDLSIHCTEQHVQQLFEGFGMIEQVRLKHASMSQSLSYAFITFVFRGDAEKALNQLNGSMLLGRKIRMNWATPKNSNKNNKDRVKENPDNLTTAQIHFSFIAKNAQGVVTEETIRDLFNGFGPVIDVAMKKCEIDHVQNVQSGYGFLHYPMSMEGIHAAIMATNTIQKIAINQIRYDSCLTRSLQKLVDETPELRRFSHSRRPTPAGPGGLKQFQSAVPMMAAQLPVLKPTFSRAPPSSFEDLDVEMEVFSLTESDSESSNHSHSESRSPANDFFFFNQKPSSLSSLSGENQRYHSALPSPYKSVWAPTRVELTTYGPSTYSTYGSSSNTQQSSYYSW